MLIKLLRFFRGSLEFELNGKYIERFLNLAARAKIPIWDSKIEKEQFKGKSLLSKREDLIKIAEKVNLEWVEKDFSGVPKIKNRYRKRIGVKIGTVVLLFLLILSQQFIWKIKVIGNENISEKEVLKSAEKYGLHLGVWKDSLDVIKIADNITVDLKDLSWSGINLIGTVAEIEVIERVMPPKIQEDEGTYNITAQKSGLLVDLEVYNGKKVAEVGDVVKQGQLLVSGIFQDKSGQTILMHSRAKAIVEYIEEKNIEIPLNFEEFIPISSHENSYRLILGDFSIPISFGKISSDKFAKDLGLIETGIFKLNDSEKTMIYSVRNIPIKIFGAELPFVLQVQQYIPAEKIIQNYTEEQAKNIALLKVDELQRILENQDITIISKEISGKIQRNKFVLNVKFRCQEDVAVESVVLTNK